MSAAESSDLKRGRACLATAFAVPLALYLITSSSSVQFDDAAQFTLCAREWSPAHPPGFPLFVMLAHLWLLPFGFVGSFAAVSALCSVFGATAIAVLYLAFEDLLTRGLRAARPAAQLAALIAALACGLGATVWQWSNTVEVYSLQLLATALALLGAMRPAGRSANVLLGAGIGIGLANHHVAMVALVPFLTWLVATTRGEKLTPTIRSLVPALGVAAGIAGLCYALLMVTATGESRFAFGQPDSMSRLWHHLSGGFFADSLFVDGVDYGGRAAVLGMVLVRHLWLFVLAAGLGVVAAWRRSPALALALLAYPALLFFLQFGRLHTPNMDAGLLPALAMLSALVALGLHNLGYRRTLLLGLIGLLAHTALNFSASNRRGYRAGEAVLEDIAASAPDRALVLLTNWELQTLTRLAIEENAFRPDLVVLPSSFKGTHRDLFARYYPEVHNALATEYDAWLAAIARVNPDYVYTDWFTFTSAADETAYRNLVQRALRWARDHQRPVLCDRATVALLLRTKAIEQASIRPSGMLFSIGRTKTELRPFPLADGWLDHSFLPHDLCAFGVLGDYRTTATQIAGYLRHRGKAELAASAKAARDRLESAWTEFLAGKPAPRKSK
ncbi:MAG: DUF2723 domain-containing protein [bacterium]|nr:DUF2723 domain-containing protein [bacterium]